jgi:type III restriction enzyme
MAIADSTPERKFIRQLYERQNAIALDAWLKNAPQRYYAIEYAWKKGEHPKRGEFSPDFFIKLDFTEILQSVLSAPEGG